MSGRRRLLAKSLRVLLGTMLLFPALSALSAAPAHADPGSEEAQFLALTNELRVSHGLNPLATNGQLLAIARDWSARMAAAGGISHNMNLPNQVSLAWNKLGENVGTGASVTSIQNAFIASPHHYVNLVDPAFNYVGIGVVDTGGRIYVTVDFMQLGAPVASAPAPAPVVRTPQPRPAAVPRRAPVPAAAPAPAPASVAATPEPSPLPAVPSPRLILSLEQVRSADDASQAPDAPLPTTPPAEPTTAPAANG